MWGLSMKKLTPWRYVRQNGRVTFDRRRGSSPIFFFFLTKNEKQKQKKPVGRLANWACEQGLELVLGWVLQISEKFPEQGSRDLYRFNTASQESGFGVSSFFLFLPLLSNYLAPNIQFFPIKIYCVSLNKRAFSVRVPYNSHTVINLLEAVWL